MMSDLSRQTLLTRPLNSLDSSFPRRQESSIAVGLPHLCPRGYARERQYLRAGLIDVLQLSSLRYFAVGIVILLCVLSFSSAAGAAPSAQEREQRAQSYFGDDVLLDQDGVGRKFYSELLKDRVVLINVVFTQCRDACPLMTQRLRTVRQQLGASFAKPVYFLSLSVDPEHDNPQLLKAFAQKQQADEPGWRFLTAEPATMHAVLKRLGQFQNQPEDHSTLLIAGNPATGHWLKIRPDLPAEAIAAKLQGLIEGP